MREEKEEDVMYVALHESEGRPHAHFAPSLGVSDPYVAAFLSWVETAGIFDRSSSQSVKAKIIQALLYIVSFAGSAVTIELGWRFGDTAVGLLNKVFNKIFKTDVSFGDSEDWPSKFLGGIFAGASYITISGLCVFACHRLVKHWNARTSEKKLMEEDHRVVRSTLGGFNNFINAPASSLAQVLFSVKYLSSPWNAVFALSAFVSLTVLNREAFNELINRAVSWCFGDDHQIKEERHQLTTRFKRARQLQWTSEDRSTFFEPQIPLPEKLKYLWQKAGGQWEIIESPQSGAEEGTPLLSNASESSRDREWVNKIIKGTIVGMSPSPALVYALVVYEELNHRLGKGIAISAATLTGTGSFALFSVQMLKALYGEKSKVDKKVEYVSILMGFFATSPLLYVLMQYALDVPALWIFVPFLAIASTAVRSHGAKQLLDATIASWSEVSEEELFRKKISQLAEIFPKFSPIAVTKIHGFFSTPVDNDNDMPEPSDNRLMTLV
ncbi:hypothetical protein CbuD7D7780_03295 [Coxiella burnetii]|uniref:Hypothetical membrane spanning protein n=1 Tax=Coxiella burnetii (strain Dugway 5J108-111) TaxID=434922 RepID=A9KC54_COXBN|nr:CBU_0635 family Dot/Icm T4SS effector [Coxiella burnetii]ABS78382.1 hypothetical membrane spanning protein [Coxiella burnetii Dugway 5J108-111]OYK80632.1 hypothetical protein CbuD7E6568_03285 [Coxiella burnetii]OYK82721.1 hypothetical protein CbuD7D7780_03295 [Coxiella burnetii]